jgi:hypothetical protein
MCASRMKSATHNAASRRKGRVGWNSEFERVYVLAAARIRGELAAARIRGERHG